MAIQGHSSHVFCSQWKGDKVDLLNNTIY